jgi:rubredoxin
MISIYEKGDALTIVQLKQKEEEKEVDEDFTYAPEKRTENKLYSCQICGFIYFDDDEKIPFQEQPENYDCPLCGSEKRDFALEEF